MVAIPGLYNTGDGISAGQQDTHYYLLTSSGTVTYGYEATNAVYPVTAGAWGEQDTTSQWLTPTATQGASVPVGSYQWTLLFDITDYEPSTAQLAGRLKSDDACIVYLNSVQIYSGGGFPNWYSFSASSGFREGINELLFVVTNSTGPSGLRVEFTSSSITAKETTPIKITGLYNTGDGYAQNTQDEHYLLSVVSGNTVLGVGQEHGYVTQDMIDPTTGTRWSRNDGISRWLTPFDDQSQSLDPTVDGVYLWRQEFNVSQTNRDAVINGRIMADDAFELRINDLYVTSGSEQSLPFDNWFEFSIRGALNVGTNYFDILVTNAHNPTGNPTGLRVELFYAVVEYSTLVPISHMMFSCNT